MIAIPCRRCGSTHLRKNGRTPSGQQKFHCKTCNFYGTLDTKDQERADRHDRAVGKESGETAHVERFNNTLRQRCANLVRKTLSFSRDDDLHEARIRHFIDHYNRQLERTGCLASV